MDRIYLDGKQLQLSPNTDIRLNYQLATVANISTRNSTYTNSIVIPRSAVNDAIFEQAGSVGNVSTLPYRRLRCDYFKDNTALINNGYAYITEVSDRGYKINLFDGIITIQEGIGKRKLTELDMSTLNHPVDINTIRSSQGNTDGYIYALADFGAGYDVNSDSLQEYQPAYTAPSVYVHTLFRKIFAEANISYYGDIFDTDEFKSLVITPSKGYNISEAATFNLSMGSMSTSTTQVDAFKPYGYDTFFRSDQSFSGASLTDSTTDARLSLDTATRKLTVDYDGYIQMAITSTHKVVYCSLAQVELYKNIGSGNPDDLSPIDVIPLNLGFSNSITYNTNIRTIQVEEGDELYFRTVFYSKAEYENGGDEVLRVTNVSTNISLKEVGGAEGINFAEILPDITHEDFVKDIMQRYGLIARRRGDKLFEFVEIEKILSAGVGVYDWSDKLISIDSTSFKSGYAQRNKAIYTYDDGVANTAYDGEMLIDDETIPVEKVIFKAPYRVPRLAAKFNDVDTLNIPLWERDEDGVVEASDYESVLATIEYGAYTSHGEEWFGLELRRDNYQLPYLSLNGINYQDNLDTYYAKFENLLNGFRRRTMSFRLDSNDLNAFNMTRLVWIKQTQRYYYIEKLQTGKLTTKGTLIELPFNPNI